MTVLILNAHKPFFEGFNAKVKFTESTKNTSTFSITQKKFNQLYQYVIDKGNNPFTVMAW